MTDPTIPVKAEDVDYDFDATASPPPGPHTHHMPHADWVEAVARAQAAAQAEES